jgi:hypothetical protein
VVVEEGPGLSSDLVAKETAAAPFTVDVEGGWVDFTRNLASIDARF